MAAADFNVFDTTKGDRVLNAAAIAAIINASPSSVAAALAAIMAASPGAGVFTTLAVSQSRVNTPAVVAAAGATQGNAGAIPATAAEVVVTVTASTQGVRLPTAATGKFVRVWPDPAVGVKIYPGTNALIGASATNAAVAIVKNKPAMFYAINTTKWRYMAGA